MKQNRHIFAERVPVIAFSKGTHGNWKTLVDTGAQISRRGLDRNLAEVSALSAGKRLAFKGTLIRSC